MHKSELKAGVSIKNKKPYEGEGEFIIEKTLKNKRIRLIRALSKHENLNGSIEIKDIDDVLKHYDIVA